MEYLELDPAEAYSLLNSTGLILVCTRSPGGAYDLAPIAWACPLDYEPVSRLLFVCDPSHVTHANLLASREFAVALPDFSQSEMCVRAGSVSGAEGDKFRALSIPAFRASRVDALVPEGVAGWLECRLLGTVAQGSVSIVMGEVLAARAVGEAWRRRLHYVSESVSYRPGETL